MRYRYALLSLILMVSIPVVSILMAAPSYAIVGGMDSADPNGPRTYTVGIMTRKGEICSGVVIAPDQILTAAHCLTQSPAAYVIALDTDFSPRLFKAARSWRNPKFRIGVMPLKQKGADIGVITLAESLPADMRPIAIADDTSALSKARRLLISGFGVTAPNDRDSAGRLRETDLKPIGLARTGTVSLFASASGEFGESERSACLGDSGGPVVVETTWSAPVLVGVISWVGGQERGKACRGVTVATPTLMSDDPAEQRQLNPAVLPRAAVPVIVIPGPDPAGASQ
jgi:secreted trypsin-like serine protease